VREVGLLEVKSFVGAGLVVLQLHVVAMLFKFPKKRANTYKVWSG
jgi:hypothetical protein